MEVALNQLKYEYGHKTVQDLVSLFERGQLNLEPGFQRDSVWQPSDRKKLIETIFMHYPIPSIFLYKQVDEQGRLVYDVIDGKQRLETILMFQGVRRFRGNRFSAAVQMDTDECEELDWRTVRRAGFEHRLMGYKIQTVEIEGDLSDIISLFVRINSTGKGLTSAEKRHARYFRSPWFLAAQRLARKHHDYFASLLTSAQISRMKHVELVCELLASVCNGGIIDKKKAVDKVIGGDLVDRRELENSARKLSRVLHLLQGILPEITTTRFANVVDFYSLYMLIYEFEADGLILTDRRRNAQAQVLLVEFAKRIDEVRIRMRNGEGVTLEDALYRDYLVTVQGNTDSLVTRRRRADILRGLLGGLFEVKDERRVFTREQRRLVWHTAETRRCCSCREALTWENFTIDHVIAHSRGGRTSQTNAALMCRSCNSRKGAR
ncbi:MAG TPA: DUF262 domain-containing protein [Candidatus Kapabacteria bacterium]|nr:DUF262 domain-containing protein [Candidatus Kapabacteria bacterium]